MAATMAFRSFTTREDTAKMRGRYMEGWCADSASTGPRNSSASISTDQRLRHERSMLSRASCSGQARTSSSAGQYFWAIRCGSVTSPCSGLSNRRTPRSCKAKISREKPASRPGFVKDSEARRSKRRSRLMWNRSSSAERLHTISTCLLSWARGTWSTHLCKLAETASTALRRKSPHDSRSFTTEWHCSSTDSLSPHLCAK
mmetsp:Transcript_46429/g.129199  ORF Transcript_46429/g.129199 Transcript_46429/m.129199 type:complete len:201 (-) Transcript_46429:476-1078(-)